MVLGIKLLLIFNCFFIVGVVIYGVISVYSIVKRGLLVFFLIFFVFVKFEIFKDLGEFYVESKI